MKLENILKGIKTVSIKGAVDQEIKSIQIDSRKVSAHHLFIAIKGTITDGHKYIDKAILNGATAIVCEKLPAHIENNVCYVQVESSDSVLGLLASNFYEDPSKDVKLIGVTGTNGKTTVATLLFDTFRKLGYKVGLLSTVCNCIGDETIEATHTTPDSITLNELIRKMVNRGCDYIFMEVSSHAVVQKRIAGVNFTGAIFTNLTRDHLDYHKTVENYLKAKKEFFDGLPQEAFCLINTDDKNGVVMTQNTKAKIHSYSLRSISDFKVRILESHFNGMVLQIDNQEVVVQFTGKFNAYNILAVYGAAKLLGQDSEEILIALSSLHSVSGRFETLQSPTGFTAIVDYAHTPDALTNVLTTIHDILNGSGKVITVVGAGGNRDKGKRPLMAKEAVKNSDKVIITSDNPRFEKPQDIINDMLAELTIVERQNVLSIESRREAIRTACFLAQPGDVVLIAGKGHETYQEIEGIKHHFDDKEEVYTFFNSMKTE